ncbi:hypothetical protein GCM10010978_06800 [Compostibacillus humi]|uniref:Uncharacterized protein n=2 Tax=Compostibacillus humi TaxID=1245525 RepID=A0A8J2ZQ35_9BACI|nr:hypothetical protein GCM10010978_06800 [Compostibacillus humi]
MQIMRANEVPSGQLEEFLQQNETLDSEVLEEKGYIVSVKDHIAGCFVLDEMEKEDVYWLKQLYITKNEANKLPVLLEAILALAKAKQAKSVYVHSHQPIVDILLEAMQFHLQRENVFANPQPKTKGNWWYYQVS